MENGERKSAPVFIVVLSAIVVIIGFIGIGISFLYMGSDIHEGVLGGGLGLIACSVMIGTGLISLAISRRHIEK